jgi:hypothetical protein
LAIEAMRSDIELILRDEYENKWQEAMRAHEEQMKSALSAASSD